MRISNPRKMIAVTLVVTSNTLIGSSRGSIGNATMTRVKGQNILKEKIIQASGPLSDPRLLQRDRVAILMPIARALKLAIDQGYAKLAKHMSAFNAYFQDNLMTATSELTASTAEFTAAAMKIAKGTIGTTPISAVNVTTATTTCVITWPAANAPVGSSVDDEPFVGIYNITTGVFTAAIGTAAEKRSTGTWTVTLAGTWTTADVLATYLSFRNPLTGQVSDSIYSADAS